jgi:surfactin synthase thioesterase subunit
VAPEQKWLMTLKRATGTRKFRLICFAYAGGTPELFRSWSDALDDEVELLAVRLPGHSIRISENPYDHWDPLLNDVFAALAARLAEPHAFYGHSFGGRLAYELAHMIQARYPGQTRQLFIGGCRSPDSAQRRPYMHELSDEGFLDAVHRMGGTPTEVLQNKEVLEMILPTLRSEIKLAELWNDRHRRACNVPITAICGTEDTIESEQSMRNWQQYTSKFEFVTIPGGHWFLETHRRYLLQVLNTQMRAHLHG